MCCAAAPWHASYLSHCLLTNPSWPTLPSPHHAVADVWQLLRAKQALEGDLGPAAATQVEALSAAYGEWGLEPGDRRNAAVPGGGGGYAAAVRLPLGKTMQLSVDEGQGYRPRWGAGVGS